MTISDILNEVRRIEITTRGLVKERFGGEYHSSFKGQGIDFDDLREYQPGDEIRSIDWNTTARLGHPYIKKFVEERELTVFLAIDVSASGSYGSIRHSKRQLAARVAAILAFSAIQNQDKVGLLLFTDRTELYLPPRKGRPHILRLIREILTWEPQHVGTDPRQPLDYLARHVSRRALVFVLSDFLCPHDFSKSMQIANIRHDVVAMQITDPAELELPNVGTIRIADPETGEQRQINTSHHVVRDRYHRTRDAWQEGLDRLFRRLSIDKIDLSTDPDVGYLPALHAFFRKRESRAH